MIGNKLIVARLRKTTHTCATLIKFENYGQIRLLLGDIVLNSLTIVSLTGALITIVGTLWGGIKLLQSYLAYKRIPDYLTGIYTGYFVQTKTGKINFDLVDIRKRRFGLKGETIYAHTLNYDYSFIAKKIKYTKNIYEGRWINKHTRGFIGSFQFKVSQKGEDIFFEGGWIGPNENEIVKFGDWKLTKSELKKLPKKQRPRNLNISLTDKIIRAHEAEPDRVERIKNIEFSVPIGVFNPMKGKISIPLLEKVKSDIGFPEKILDIGCGCGLYALYFANYGAEIVFASESDVDSLNAAKFNASKNRLEDKVTFIESTAQQLYHNIPMGEKFDLIIANLPFTAKESCLQNKNSKYYQCFAASRSLYFNLILGAQFHLRNDGYLYFSFAESGYESELHAYFKLGNLEYTRVKRIVEKDDTFFIYKAKLNKNCIQYSLLSQSSYKKN